MQYIIVDPPKEKLERLVEETLYLGIQTIHVYQSLKPGEQGWVDCYHRITDRSRGIREYTWYKLVLEDVS